MSELTQKYCRACEAGTPPMSMEEAHDLIEQVPGWELGENKLTRRFKFKNFREAMAFVNRVAELAEDEGHHPDIHISWNRVRLDLTTHAIKGLSENDFIMAAKTNDLTS
jgi:4a-hydroxytetrahydrobiopterin dehydratase